MNTETIKTTAELFEMLTAAGSDHARALIAHAGDTTREYESARERLARQLEFIRTQVDQAIGQMNAGQLPNSMGVLQGNGVETDRLCGELARSRQAAVASQKLLTSLGIH